MKKLFSIYGIFVLTFLIQAFCICQIKAQNSLPQLGKNSIQEVIQSMTTEEKVKLLIGNGFHFPVLPDSNKNGNNKGGAIGVTEDKVPGAAGTTYAIPRLGIPSIVLADGPAGIRISPYRGNDSLKSYFATAFPIGSLLSSTWDTSIVRKVGESFGSEINNYGVDLILAPAMNIHRNPLGGRNFEYYSEDPLLSGTICAAMVNGIQSNGVGTSIKHFVANNQETDRTAVNTIVSERALREIYLKGFEIAVKKSQPWTVMSSYNLINGTYTSESEDLLTEILRNEWGFKGLVMTDWFGGKDAVAQMKAGNDLLMPGTPNQEKSILSALKHDSLSIEIINRNVERVLQLVLKSPTFRNHIPSNQPDLKANAQVSRMAATEGMVLLKNVTNSLPLQNNQKLAIFGNTSYNLIAGGLGSGDVNKAYTISLIEGLKNASFRMDPDLLSTYQGYIKQEKAKQSKPKSFFDRIPPIPEYMPSESLINTMVSHNDIAIITLGRISGEFFDRSLDGDFLLTSTEKTLLQNISNAFHQKGKKVIVVLNIGGVVETASWENWVDGILLVWQPGLEAGNAIADVLSGKVNPSGKLATTFPVLYQDIPSSKNFPGKEFKDQVTPGMFGIPLIPAEVRYEEGIMVGYRYFTTYNVKTAYPFGYGLSYTSFDYSKPTLSSNTFKDQIIAGITITNSGRMKGKEVVEVYISTPKKTMFKPIEELKAFAKTKLLSPGESETLYFTINSEDLASFDTKSSAWKAEKGNYRLKFGASSTDIRQVSKFNLPEDLITEKVKKSLSLTSPKVDLKELEK